MRRFDVAVLDQAYVVVAHNRLTGYQLSYWPQVAKDFHHQSGHHSGCYQERMEMAGLTWHDRVILPSVSSNEVNSEEGLFEEVMHGNYINTLFS